MPWISESGNKYQLCMLDTNILSEILKHPEVEGKGFIKKFRPRQYAPCFSIYNLIEIRRRKDIYNKFIDFFSKYPCFLLKPFQLLFEDELKSYHNTDEISALFNSFSHFGNTDSHNTKKFLEELFEKRWMKDIEKNWEEEKRITLNVWLNNKRNFKPTKKFANARDGERYIEEAGIQTLIRLKPDWVKNKLDNGYVPNIDKFSSIKVMLYSQYYRLYDPHWKVNPQEVTDVEIAVVAPYVDAFITEKFQANIFDKIKNKVKGLEKLDVYRLKDIRE